ncbi:hypothetical protein CcaverHIS002_0608080 [Cutaneotrichosporon cavernicola]|uniref:PUB domain-containing protein n=1 Tax=Cutaneotrichosporon cavernicola TaxID=279322 RepID=A0AA48L945_9TREE|nr:uncharacterized protein CcaverHIS019_0607530 [Cutaneotrichosporon cavernicola]BEI86521.1 hypothetical protein CcaverHIS002_0608080 [Cutaneotrichosporon cavernicola]BEI94294.1 hypothetical protein CcaverHIS019_0607530 [Cutaneotrichosporon cavernicola]BEJ02071.1 hypothetical protein CcaverHIS631_0607530 [Cutaneotrichosporon cavernicola]BEJ09834.1 hypothetical protein CcaverHIS641_0607490 [Cutaneotrichosporon cavernicola]
MEYDRARRLAAIQARLAPPPDAAPVDSVSSGTNASLIPAPRHLPKAWTRPSEREEREMKRELARVLQRTIVRDSGYRQAATCVETLVKIASNIQSSPDPKFRSLKSDNAALKHKVLAIPGGREYLVMMGFRVYTANFVQSFVLDQSDRRMYELGIATDVLREALPDLQSRVTGSNLSKTSHKAEEAARIAAAKRQIEDDRNVVRERVERERVVRDVRAEAEAKAEHERKVQEEREEAEERAKAARREARGAGARATHPHTAPNMTFAAAHGEDEEFQHEYPSSDGEDSDEGYWNQRRWGQGNKLGK